jgi:hypothetical protein
MVSYSKNKKPTMPMVSYSKNKKPTMPMVGNFKKNKPTMPMVGKCKNEKGNFLLKGFMSLKKVEQVKKDKGFRLADLLVYGVILLVIAALFLGVSFLRSNPINGVQVLYHSEVVFEYYFGGDAPTYNQAHIGNVEETSQKITFTFYGQSENDYNLITIDKTNLCAYVTEANCNRFYSGRECLHMDKVSTSSSIILCTPHAMQIVPISSEQSPTNPFPDEPDNTIPV